MGMRPYAADCGALVLPLASKVKLRAPSKDLYFNFDDIRIEIPRQARDDGGIIPRQARDDGGVLSLGKLGMTGGYYPSADSG